MSILLAIVNVYYWELRNARLVNKNKEWVKPYIPNSRISKIQSILMVMLMIVFSFVLVYLYKDNAIIFTLKRIALVAILFPIALSDYKDHLIPNTALILALIYWIILTGLEFVFNNDVALKYLIQEVVFMIIFFGILLLFSVILKGGIGMGDIKLLMVMALLEGSGGIMSSVTTSLFFLLLTSVVMLLTRKKKAKDFIPLAFVALMATGVYQTS